MQALQLRLIKAVHVLRQAQGSHPARRMQVHQPATLQLLPKSLKPGSSSSNKLYWCCHGVPPPDHCMAIMSMKTAALRSASGLATMLLLVVVIL